MHYKSIKNIVVILFIAFSLLCTGVMYPGYNKVMASDEVTEDVLEDTVAAPEETENTSVNGQTWPVAPELNADAVVLMEANTDAVVYQKNADDKMYPASTTKILTAIIVLENSSLDEIVTFTEECVDLEEGAVTIDTVVGEQMSLKDALYGLLLPSANDCAMALALHVAGSIDAFAEMMNEKAKEIGATSSNFRNPSGLFHSDHYTTASDMALIAQYAFRNSTFVDIISHPTYIIEPTNMTADSRVLTNSHEMIIPGNPDYSSDVIGGKTGYLYEAGRCLVTYAERDGITLLSVILNGGYYGIFSETQELLDFGWQNFKTVNVSEEERRFSYADENAKVQLDPSSQILTLKGVEFSDLTTVVNYAYSLNDREYAEAKKDAGITDGDSRQLYAWIDYYYAGYFLGKCNVFINPELSVSQASFVNVVYINIWLIILVVIVLIAAVLLVMYLARKAAQKSTAGPGMHKRPGRRKTRYYSKGDSVDLRNQYVKSSERNKRSVHSLSDIGIDEEMYRNIETNRKFVNRSNSGGKNSKTQRQSYSERDVDNSRSRNRRSYNETENTSDNYVYSERRDEELLRQIQNMNLNARTNGMNGKAAQKGEGSAQRANRRKSNGSYNELSGTKQFQSRHLPPDSRYSRSYDFTEQDDDDRR